MTMRMFTDRWAFATVTRCATLRAHPARKAVHEQWFKRSAAFFSKQGLVAGLDLAALWEDPPWQAS